VTEKDWESGDWRVVGYNPYKRGGRSNSVGGERYETFGRRLSAPTFSDAFYQSVCKIKLESRSVGDILNNIGDVLYLIEFGSGRLDIAYVFPPDGMGLIKDDHVIIEADRGEDCGRVVCLTSKERYKKLLNRIDKNEITKEVHPKRVYRRAEEKDLDMLKYKNELEKIALSNCRERVCERGLVMEVVDCEYQWDMNKLTFFFVSERRVDFRELVKELYKVYKTRIWMCAVEKSKNCYLRELIER
jgi:cell fate regulator YaaT (PSP1 superfamily)